MLNLPTPNIRSIEDVQNYLYQVAELINNTSISVETTGIVISNNDDKLNESIRYVLSQVGSKYVSRENLPNLETDPTVSEDVKAITSTDIDSWNNKLDSSVKITNAEIDEAFNTVFEEEDNG